MQATFKFTGVSKPRMEAFRTAIERKAGAEVSFEYTNKLLNIGVLDVKSNDKVIFNRTIKYIRKGKLKEEPLDDYFTQQ